MTNFEVCIACIYGAELCAAQRFFRVFCLSQIHPTRLDLYFVVFLHLLFKKELWYSIQKLILNELKYKRVLSKYTCFGLLLIALQKASYEDTPLSSLLLNPSLLQNVIYQAEEKALFFLSLYISVVCICQYTKAKVFCAIVIQLLTHNFFLENPSSRNLDSITPFAFYKHFLG